MAGFTKLFSEILSSSIWNEDDKTRIVFITMLAGCDQHGIVRASVGGLAHQARVSRDACAKALEILTSPDEDSRNKDFEGRRVAEVPGGFQILNYAHYREARGEDERREYMRRYMQEYRKRSVNNGEQIVNSGKQKLADVNPCKPPLAQAEADADTEEEKKTPPPSPPADKPPKVSFRKSRLSREQCVALAKQHKLPDRDGHWFFDSMESGGWMRGKNAIRDAEAHFRSYVTGCWLPSLQGGNGAPKPAPKYSSETGPKERALKEREKQLRDELPDEAQTAAMLAKLAGRFPTSRTEP